MKNTKMLPSLLAGHPFSSERREKAASASATLANDFPANADLEATALHAPGEWASGGLASSPAQGVFFWGFWPLTEGPPFDDSVNGLSSLSFHSLQFAAVCQQAPFLMRSILALLAFAAVLSAGTSASAERRMFVIANNPNGYGVDRCLASGATCGAAIAAAYCRSREFSQAVSYRRVDKDDITGAAPAAAPGGCLGNSCDDYVAIECMR